MIFIKSQFKKDTEIHFPCKHEHIQLESYMPVYLTYKSEVIFKIENQTPGIYSHQLKGCAFDQACIYNTCYEHSYK